nr:hypothetical protein [Tanacetum cinerariifolium]
MFNSMCFFLIWSSSSNNPQNTDGDAAFEVKEPKFEGRKPESEVHVSSSSSAQQRSMMTRPRERLKARVLLIPAVGQISTNNTNTFSAAGPSNTVEEGIDYEEVFALVARIKAI